MPIHPDNLRASEKVQQYLQEYIEQSDRLPGDRLPSSRQIAERLSVSESTVRGTIRQWVQQGKLRSRQGSGVFLNPPQPSTSSRSFRIGANTRHHLYSEDHTHWGKLIHTSVWETVLELGPKGVFSAIYSSEENINSLPIKEVINRCKDLDGLVLFQVDPHTPEIVEYCKKHNKPFVYLNPPSDHYTSNFVALESTGSMNKITKSLLQCGRRKFALFIYPNLDASVSNRQKVSGVVNAIGPQLGNGVDLRIILCKDFTEFAGYQATKQLINDNPFHPDVILTTGDGPTLGAIQALQEMGISVPDEISVISGAGHDLRIQERQITSLIQPVRQIGRTLVTMLLEMIEQEIHEIPAQILPASFYIGKTTTPQESQQLQNAFSLK